MKVATHSPPSRSEISNERHYTRTSSVCFSGLHKDKFTFLSLDFSVDVSRVFHRRSSSICGTKLPSDVKSRNGARSVHYDL